MKKNHFSIVFKSFFMILALIFSSGMMAQQKYYIPQKQNDFWSNVQFGGGVGLSFGSGYTDISLLPSMIYNVNPIVSVGVGLQFGYVASKNEYSSFLYGGSLIGLINPIPEIQLSAELEQINVNTDYKYIGGPSFSDNFWNTALFLGAGYRTGNVTIGIRYDVLHDDNKSIYGEAFMPFVRVYF
ncbi:MULTISPECIES: hypothetical protein [unclassified Flavobacterium]|uniref:hypothetical protein n=1 Tax=unclassified Flavobacterium TaxID=196869 RepID=UPI00057E5CEB|nr:MULTISPECIES: hypothetical protein [unclassified Flavobacterium]KIA97847.1 hypothetical protein OA93_12795 [Flavobacterium sp. KMS]KIC03818.1 hypothetical protein OA88_01610 [Flavobacterium sp. JRM]MEA9413830.1 hypothetical protein [Flavobacterium sp. PL02]OUL64146.1 hypothetical protein B8T70_01530 [Flavobacterium sp. AJR]